MNKRWKFFTIAAIIIFISVVSLFLIKYLILDKKVEYSSSPFLYSFNEKSDADYLNELKKYCNEFPDIKSAEKSSGFKTLSPKNIMGGKIKGIFTDKYSPGEKRMVRLIYSNFRILENPGVSIDSYKDYIEARRKDIESGQLKYDKAPQLIEINGKEGMGTESGYCYIDNKKEKYPACVFWNDNGAQIAIISQDDNIRLPDLIKVAESMYD